SVHTLGCSNMWSSTLIIALVLDSAQVVELRGVSPLEFLSFVLRYAGKRALNELPRIRITRRNVRKVGLPHDIVYPYFVAHLNAARFEPKVYVDLPPHHLTGAFRQALLP